MKKERAREIAGALNNVKRWNSHGIGINMHVLRRELKLRIDDFGAEKELKLAIRAYHELLFNYLNTTKQTSVVHTRETFEPLSWRTS